VRVDRQGKTRALYRVASAKYPGTPEQAARAFLGERISLLKIQTAALDLRTEQIQNVPGGVHVRFRQHFNGIPVYRGDVVVSLNARNEVGMVCTNAQDDILLPSTTPSIPDNRAVSLARTYLQAAHPAIGGSERAELTVFQRSPGDYRLAYRVGMVLEDPPGDWEILIDAQTGSELYREDRYVNHHGSVDGVTGTGYVYLTNPISAAGSAYGAPGFLDNGNADSDSLTKYRTLVPLDSLTFENGVYKLNGPACTITDIESPPDPPFYAELSPDGFRYTRSQAGFEAVMAYYHVTAAYRRFVELGFSSDALRQLRVDPHGYQGKDNSHFSPGGNWIAFGTGGVHDAQDADVIWHEYGHAIEYNIIPTWGGGECAALGEGFGDYWAGSHSRAFNQWNPSDPQYNWLFLWDGHNEFWPGRILNDPHRYPFGALSIYGAGQVWSSTLMGIREDIGRDVADRLVLKSLYYLAGGATAVDNAEAMLQADRDLYNGSHLPTLMYWLSTLKGFIPSGTGNAVLLVNDELPSSSDTNTTTQKGISVVYSGPSSQKNMTSMLPSIPLATNLGMQTTTFAGLDTAVLSTTKVLFLMGGINPHPFNDPVKRRAVVEFARRGGQVFVEGGEVGYYYRSDNVDGEVDSAFRTTVLHVDGFFSDGKGTTLLCDGGAGTIFSQPHQIAGPLAITQRSSCADRDLMIPEQSASTDILAHWSNEESSPAAIANYAADGTVRSLYLPFSLASIADTTQAMALMENAISYVLYYRRSATGVPGGRQGLPASVALHQNYPNPFNPSTTIMFDLATRARVRLSVYTLLGQEVATLEQGELASGQHSYRWDGRTGSGQNASSGVYLFRIEAERSGSKFVQSRMMTLIR
jgi:zinc metalloprotease ZmpB